MKIYFGGANNGVARVLPATSCGVVLQHLMLLALLSAPSGVFGQDYGKASGGYEWKDFNQLAEKPDVHTSKKFSDESDELTNVPLYSGFNKMKCFDKYCDKKQVSYVKDMGKSPLRTRTISEEDDSKNRKYNEYRCDDDELMMAYISCDGSYCDNISLYCMHLSDEYRFKPGEQRTWLNWFSEENGGSSSCPDGAFVTGMKCEGKNCDNLKLECRKVQKKQYFEGCKSFSTKESNDEEPVSKVEYLRGAKEKGYQSETLYPLNTEISLSCDHEPYWYPSTPKNGSKNLKCTTDGWKEDNTRIKMDSVHCDCGKCSYWNFPLTEQTRIGVVQLKIDDNKPEGAKQCTHSSKHPQGTTIKFRCKFEPFMSLSPGVSAEIECQNDGSWKNTATFKAGEDYCKCNVSCPKEGNTNSNFCLGTHEGKTSINNVKFEWLGSHLEIDWKDSCQDTQYQSYQISLLRRYWSEVNNAWTSPSLAGVVKRGQSSKMIDRMVESDVPDHVPFVPGLHIQYEWKQEAEFDNRILPFAAFKDRIKMEATVPFLFDFSALVTSPDRSVDTVGATITVTDVQTGKELYVYVTPKRSFTPGGARELPEVLPVRLDSFGTGIITRKVKVTVNYLDHEFRCDPPLCSESGKSYYVGEITHLDTLNLFFTDTSVVTIRGKVTMEGSTCPVKGVTLKVTPVGGFGQPVIFPDATDAQGEYKISAPLGQVDITPSFEDHNFQYENTFTIGEDMNSVNFLDTTKRDLTINLLGGASEVCNATIGTGFVRLQKPDLCYDKMFSIGPDPQTHQIPALDLNMKIDVGSDLDKYGWKWAGEAFANFDSFMIASGQYTLGSHEVMAEKSDYDVTFRYRSIVTANDIEFLMKDRVSLAGSTDILATKCSIDDLKLTRIEDSSEDSGTTVCPMGIEPDDKNNIWTFTQADKLLVSVGITESYGTQTCVGHGKVQIIDNWGIQDTSTDEGDGNNKVELILDEDGFAHYPFTAGSPEFSCPFTKLLGYQYIPTDTATDTDGKNDIIPSDYATIDDFIPDYHAKAVIQGIKAASNESPIHITSTDVVPLMILRDPPGAGSYSSITKSTEIALSTSMQIEAGGGTKYESLSSIGIDSEIAGLGPIVKLRKISGIATEMEMMKSESSSTENSFAFSFTESFTSSTDPALTGKYGDVIIGMGATFAVIPAYEIEWDETQCSIASVKTVGFDSDPEDAEDTINDQPALYAYTHWYIENVMIPEYEALANNPDLEWNRESNLKKANAWRKILETKDNEGGVNLYGEGASFFADIEKFIDETDDMYNKVLNADGRGLLAASFAFALAGIVAEGAASIVSILTSLNFEGIGTVIVNAVAITANAAGAHKNDAFGIAFENFKESYWTMKEDLFALDMIAEDGFMRVTIDGGHEMKNSVVVSSSFTEEFEHVFEVKTGLGWTAKFETNSNDAESKVFLTSKIKISSQGSNTFSSTKVIDWTINDPDIGDHYLIEVKEDPTHGSPIFKVLSGVSLCRHEEGTTARQGIEIELGELDSPERDNLDPLEPAVFIVRLRHTGYDPVHPWYNVRLIRSEMLGKTGLVTFAGHSLTNFIEFTDMVKDQWVEVELVVHRSYTEYYFQDLTLEAYSQCEDEFSRNQMPVEKIHDTLSFSATWREPCGDALIEPDVDFISVQSSSTVPFPIEIYNPDHQLKPWYRTDDGFYMKFVWKVWTPDGSALRSYIKDDNKEDIVKTKEIFSKDRSQTTSFEWNLAALNDGKYTLEVELNCPGRLPEYTEPKTVFIQRTELQIIGNPQPSDGGIYAFDEDIVVRFNREIYCFNPNMEIIVQYGEDNQVVPMHLLCKENILTAVPTVKVDFYKIAGEQLKITFKQVMDFAGNRLNSEDGVNPSNGNTWNVMAQGSDNLDQLPARMSLCIREETVLTQLEDAKYTFIGTVGDTFKFLDGVHPCRMSVSDPYQLDGSCGENGRWDLVILPSSSLSEACIIEATEKSSTSPENRALSSFVVEEDGINARMLVGYNDETEQANLIAPPIEVVNSLRFIIEDPNSSIDLPYVNLTLPIAVSLTSSFTEEKMSLNTMPPTMHPTLPPTMLPTIDTNYLFVQGKSSSSNDIERYWFKGITIDDMKSHCDANEECLGFNSNGWMKYHLKPENKWINWTNDPNKGFYIKVSEKIDTNYSLEEIDTNYSFVQGKDSGFNDIPSDFPSLTPTMLPSMKPSTRPSFIPSRKPSVSPTWSKRPSIKPTSFVSSFHSSENFDIRLGSDMSYTIISNGPLEVIARCSTNGIVSLEAVITNDARTTISVYGFVPTTSSIPTYFAENIDPTHQTSKLLWNSVDDKGMINSSSGYYIRVQGSVIGIDREDGHGLSLFGSNIECVVAGAIMYGYHIPIDDITREPSDKPSTSPTFGP